LEIFESQAVIIHILSARNTSISGT